MKKTLILYMMLFLGMVSKAATITSASGGGNWDQTGTWIGGVIPGMNDDVIINGAVSVGGSLAQCRNLTVNSGARIENQYGYHSTLRVNGNVNNNGLITNSSSARFTLEVYGNISNNGVWNNYYLELKQTGTHSIGQGTTGRFGHILIYLSTSDSLSLTGNVAFDSCNITGVSGQLRHVSVGLYKLILNKCNLNNVKITGTGTIDLNNTILTGVHIYGKPNIEGRWSVGTGVELHGTPVLKGDVVNEHGYTRTLVVYDSLINEGNIINNAAGSLYLDIHGHLHQAGVYNPYSSTLKSGGPHYLSAQPGAPYEGRWYAGSDDSIDLRSDVRFKKCLIDGTGSSATAIRTSGHSLYLDTCQLFDMSIKGNDSLFLEGCQLENAVSVLGDAILAGEFFIGSNVLISGNILNLGTLRNQYGYTRTLDVFGQLDNKGSIERSGSGNIYINLHGHLHQSGVYNPYATTLLSNQLHHLSADTGVYFTGRWYFGESDSIEMKSDLRFKHYLIDGTDANASVIRTRGFTLSMDSSIITDVIIRGNDSISLQGSTLENKVSVEGNARLSGLCYVGSNIRFNGVINHYGSLLNQYGYTRTFDVFGTLNNLGAINNNSSGYINIRLHGNLHQGAVYAPFSTTLASGGTHYISADSGTHLTGSWYFGTSDSVELKSQLRFKHSTLDGDDASGSAIYTSGHPILFDTCSLIDLRIHGNDSIGFEGSKLNSNISLNGNFRLSGSTEIGTNVVFDGNISNYGTLQNYYGYYRTIKSKKHLKNYGTIKNHTSGAITIEVNGSIHNAGVYQALSTYFKEGSSYVISQDSGTFFTSDFYLSDTNSVLNFGSNIHFKHSDFQSTATPNPYSFVKTHTHQWLLDTCSVKRVRIESFDTIHNSSSAYYDANFYGSPKLVGSKIVDNLVVYHDTVSNFGSINNYYGYNVDLEVKGLLNNYGLIGSLSSGNIRIELYGSIFNAGVYRPAYTNFRGSNTHGLSSLNRSPLEGDFYTDAAHGQVLAFSDLLFKKGTINLEKTSFSTINSGGHTLVFDSSYLSRCKIVAGDSVYLTGNTRLWKVDFEQRTRLFGNWLTDGLVSFNDTLYNYSTIYNNAGYYKDLVVFGPLFNFGDLITNPQGGRLTLVSYSDLFNDGLIKLGEIHLSGNKPRTIVVPDYLSQAGNYFAIDTLTLKGDNTLPNLAPYSGPKGYLSVDSGATLACNGINYTSHFKLNNKGRIHARKPIDNSRSSLYNFAHAQLYNNSGTDIQELLVESYGYQKHPSAQTGISMWWRLRPSPLQATDSLKELQLYYDTQLLDGAEEKDLDVYFSSNAGIDWRKMQNGVVKDTIGDRFRIYNAPAYGHYLISGSGLGIVTYEPQIHRAEPRIFGNKGKLTLYGFGLGLSDSMKVSLRRDSDAPIVADTFYLTDALGESFLAVFDVDFIPQGLYDLVLELPGKGPLVLSKHFTVEEAERPEPWAILNGRDRFLVGRWQTFTLSYGNKANTDAGSVPLFFVVNHVPGMEVDFPDFQVGIQKSFVDEGWTQWQDTSIDLYYLSDSFGGYEGTLMRIYPFIIPSIGANSAQSIRVRIKIPTLNNLTMAAWITDPLSEGLPKQFKESMPPEVAWCIAEIAAKYAWDKAIGFIPGYDCYKLAYKVGETGVAYVLKDPNEPEKPTTFYSAINAFWGWGWSIAECAGDIIPVSKGIKIAKDLIDIGFDMKNNYDADRECREKFKGKSNSQLRSRGVFSFDPNEIVGPQGFGPDRYISDATHMAYTVYFENKDTATAAAAEVLVRDTLDKNVYDFASFSFQNIGIADSVYEIQGFANEFRLLIDLTPRIHTLVQVTGSLDTATGEIVVRYLSLDRSSLEEQEDVDLGFLPPNKNAPQGEGNFSYSVGLKPSLTHNTTISNQALIYFDANPPIVTNLFVNHIDTKVPQSAVRSLPAKSSDTTFTVEWSGIDQGCGIEYYSVYVSVNDSNYRSWIGRTSDESAAFTGKNGYLYKFYCVATDSLGLSEEHPLTEDASTEVALLQGINGQSTTLGFVKAYPNPAQNVLRIELLNNFSTGSAQLFDLQGRLFLDVPLSEGVNEINVSNVPRQLYLLRCFADGMSSAQLILLNK